MKSDEWPRRRMEKSPSPIDAAPFRESEASAGRARLRAPRDVITCRMTLDELSLRLPDAPVRGFGLCLVRGADPLEEGPSGKLAPLWLWNRTDRSIKHDLSIDHRR